MMSAQKGLEGYTPLIGYIQSKHVPSTHIFHNDYSYLFPNLGPSTSARAQRAWAAARLSCPPDPDPGAFIQVVQKAAAWSN